MGAAVEILFLTILTTEYWEVDMASGPRIIRLRRTEQALRSVEAVNEAFASLNVVLERIPQRTWGLLFDVRRARPAHNKEIEKAFRENRSRCYRAFGRFGVLVGTAAGVMQVRRMLRETPDARICVFCDEEEAFRWVAAKESSKMPTKS